jgi:hypothetical protein
VRAVSAKSEDSLKIFAVVVSIKRCSWLSFVVTTSTSSFNLFCVKIQFLQSSILLVKDCKPALLGGVPPADVLSAVGRSCCKQRVVFVIFEALCGDGICRYPFFLLPFQCIFQAQMDDKQSTEEDDQRALQCNFIFFISFCVKLSFQLFFLI